MNNNHNKLKTKFINVTFFWVIFHLFSFHSLSQVLKIDYFGEMTLPEEMEVQAGTFKERTDAYGKTLIGTQENHQSLVFQQKGLNSADTHALKTYARVVIDTYKGEPGTYKQLSIINNLTKDDIAYYKNNFETQLETVWPKAKQKLINSSEITISKVGKNYCTKHSYIRQLENSPQVFVETFRVQNNDRVHLISFSYRTKDEKQWKPVMENILKSIEINKF